MDPMPWITLAVLLYLAGAGMGHYPGPFRLVARAMSDVMTRHENRRSDHVMTPEEDTDPDVMTPDEGSPEGPRQVRVDSRNLRGPRPLDELLDEAGLADDDEIDEDDGELPDRLVWVKARMREGWRPGQIDDLGADLYGVHPRTIARDRDEIKKALAARRGRGNVGGPQQ